MTPDRSPPPATSNSSTGTNWQHLSNRMARRRDYAAAPGLSSGTTHRPVIKAAERPTASWRLAPAVAAPNLSLWHQVTGAIRRFLVSSAETFKRLMTKGVARINTSFSR